MAAYSTSDLDVKSGMPWQRELAWGRRRKYAIRNDLAATPSKRMDKPWIWQDAC
jgi:hypothetical protein